MCLIFQLREVSWSYNIECLNFEETWRSVEICWACWAFSLAASQVVHPLLSAIRTWLFTFRSLGEVNGLPPSQRFCQDDTQRAFSWFSCRFAWCCMILHVLKSVTRPKKSCTAAPYEINRDQGMFSICKYLYIYNRNQQNVSPEGYKHFSGGPFQDMFVWCCEVEDDSNPFTATPSCIQIAQIGSVVSVQTSKEVQRSFSNWLDVIPQTSDPFIREIGSRQPLTFRELHAFAQDPCAEYYWI